MIEVVRYSTAAKGTWDAFVKASKNGTFLLLRDYMDYHADRFRDHSLLFYRKRRLVALLPANEAGGEIHTHEGLSYGGVISCRNMKAALMLEVFEAMSLYYRKQGYRKLKYKAIPAIYHQQPAEEDLYALYRFGALLCRRDAGVAIALEQPLGYATLRRRKLKKAVALQLSVSQNYARFMQLKQQLLQQKYQATPAHTAEEVALLASRFPQQIKLYTTQEGSELLAGILVYETQTAAHCQYTATSPKGRALSALDVLTDYLLREAYRHKSYFSFGISTEQEGHFLNQGLMAYKESYGARTIVHDFYELSF